VEHGGRGRPPFLLTLLGLIERHRGAFDYDWRTRFHLGVDEMPARMGWAEAWRLVQALVVDPSSHVAAAVNGWDFPTTREALTLADLYDAYASATFKKPKRYPRPWADKDVKRIGKTSLPQAQVRAILASRAPQPPSPTPPSARRRDARGRFLPKE
jgi:hypothetical protein